LWFSLEYIIIPFGLTNIFCLVPTTYEFILLEHINKFVVEPIDNILTFSMFEDIHIGHWALLLETYKNHLCAITKYMFWMLQVTSLFVSCAIVERCRREFKKIFLCSLENHLELVMRVRIILEMTGCCLHLLENFLYAH
jgi:hypothetical protein